MFAIVRRLIGLAYLIVFLGSILALAFALTGMEIPL